MKMFHLGILNHNCSLTMRRGKYIRVWNFATSKRCPNCRQWIYAIRAALGGKP